MSVADAFTPTEISSGVPVAWVTQGALVYIRGSLQPVWSDVVATCNHLAASMAWRHYRLWSEMDWRTLDASGRDGLRRQLELGPGQGAYWRIDIADRPARPDSSLEIVDVPTTRGRERASYLRLRLPLATQPNALSDLTLALSQRLPVWAGTAGFLFNPVEGEWRAAFDQIWAWARRYWGVEVADTRTGTWDVLGGLLNVNWLMLLGREFLERHRREDREVALDGEVAPAIRLHRAPWGTMVQAGPRPVLGDLNAFEDISAYADGARLVAPALSREPSTFNGMFADHGSTLRWIQRFLAPEAWLDPGSL